MTEGVICGLFILLDQVAFINKRELKNWHSVASLLAYTVKEQHLEQHKQRLTYPFYGHFNHPKMIQDAQNRPNREVFS